MTGYDSKRTAAADKDALFQKFEMVQPAQEPVADRLERLLWEYIDLQAAHPEHKPNPKTWPHLMTYAPLPVQPAQEPVGMLHITRLDKWLDASLKERKQREWVGLTDEEVKTIVANYCLTVGNWSLNGLSVAQAVAAKLKERNHGT